MEETIWIEWSYTPVNFFEEPVSISEAGWEIYLDQGKIQAKVNPRFYDTHPGLVEELEKKIESLFLGVQLVDRRKYTWSRHSEKRIMPDGTTSVTVSIGPARAVATGGRVDIIVSDKDGNVTVDTKRDRINHQRLLAYLIYKYNSGNETVRKITASYSAAISDPDDEFTHLYEIRDGLLKEFHYDSNKLKTDLRIDPSEWKWFTDTANNPDLQQSRHRGKSSHTRNATADELQRARDFALFLIEAYLKSLEAN